MNLHDQREVLFQLGEEKDYEHHFFDEKGDQRLGSRREGDLWHTELCSAITCQGNYQTDRKLEGKIVEKDESFEEYVEDKVKGEVDQNVVNIKESENSLNKSPKEGGYEEKSTDAYPCTATRTQQEEIIENPIFGRFQHRGVTPGQTNFGARPPPSPDAFLVGPNNASQGMDNNKKAMDYQGTRRNQKLNLGTRRNQKHNLGTKRNRKLKHGSSRTLQLMHKVHKKVCQGLHGSCQVSMGFFPAKTFHQDWRVSLSSKGTQEDHLDLKGCIHATLVVIHVQDG